jgi:hypothetical protein
LLPAVRPVVGNNGFGAGYHMIYAPAAYVVTFARLYSYGLIYRKTCFVGESYDLHARRQCSNFCSAV